jgi:uncharacterized protein YjaG (DUF416 family)
MSEGYFDIKALEGELSQLPLTHRLAFAASCCERLLPNYSAFSRMENWGHPEGLRSALDEVWKFLEGKKLTSEHIEEIKKKCEKATPDTEDFSSLYTSAALDAGVAILETLESCRDGCPQRIAEVASLARDTVDMYLQARNRLEYSDAAFEEKIATDSLMMRELRKQREDLNELKQVRELDRHFLNRLRHSFKNKGRSNIDVN